jgi:predicted flap endonuclease-1-like 5' DNA nuclease
VFRKYSIFIGLLITSLVQTACSSPVQEARRAQAIPWWVWVLVILVLLVLLLWWWLSHPEEKAAPTAKPEAEAPSRLVEAPVLSKAEGLEPDDLTRIEGIGPKISSLLQAAGITTFAQLAATDVNRLKQILADASLSALADPTTWPEQASLAAAGQWEALETLQGELKGGRRV